MKKIIILAISFYQNVISTPLRHTLGIADACRFSPTCSEYAKLTISKKGVINGSFLSVLRLLKCQPFYKTT
jgi:putative membrane protein insertion efficiency factor